MAASKVALAGLIALAGLTTPVSAQAPQPQRALSVSASERNALTALQTAAAGSDRAAQDAALAAARTAAQGPDARYILARLEFQIAQSRGDAQGQAAAVDALVASGMVPPSELPPLLANQASRAYSAGQFERADALLAQMAQLQPNDATIAADYAQLKARRGQRAEAVTWIGRAIELQTAAGQAVPESWYLRATALAYDGQMMPQGVAFARALVTAYPTPTNWRDALLIYRASQSPPPPPRTGSGERPNVTPRPADAQLDLDIKRAMRATGALEGERDYLEFADQLATANQMGEAKAVLDEGVSRGMLDSTEAAVRQMQTRVTAAATRGRASLAGLPARAASGSGAQALSGADTLYGYGRYAEAAALYQAALQKGGGDPNLINTRLGAALALAGRRAEAETALHAVTGPRADLAAFWLVWLARQPQAPTT